MLPSFVCRARTLLPDEPKVVDPSFSCEAETTQFILVRIEARTKKYLRTWSLIHVNRCLIYVILS